MNNKFEINEILEAVDIFLDKKKDKQVKFINESKSEKPLKLVNEIQPIEKKIEKIPNDTEKIILDAEKYLKK
tara:strand:+ start:2609 stop:2824 length:216 start_codon:yes stop_codon:yes gene_type:complete